MKPKLLLYIEFLLLGFTGCFASCDAIVEPSISKKAVKPRSTWH